MGSERDESILNSTNPNKHIMATDRKPVVLEDVLTAIG
jgi:hypothetical protein